MNNNLLFNLDISVSHPNKPLKFEIFQDNLLQYNVLTNKDRYSFSFDIPNDTNSHNIKFVMSEKTDNHTIFNSTTNDFESSAQIIFDKMTVGGVDFKSILQKNDKLITYTHDSNGYANLETTVFDFCMGFNGIVEIKYENPIYLWMFQYM